MRVAFSTTSRRSWAACPVSKRPRNMHNLPSWARILRMIKKIDHFPHLKLGRRNHECRDGRCIHNAYLLGAASLCTIVIPHGQGDRVRKVLDEPVSGKLLG